MKRAGVSLFLSCIKAIPAVCLSFFCLSTLSCWVSVQTWWLSLKLQHADLWGDVFLCASYLRRPASNWVFQMSWFQRLASASPVEGLDRRELQAACMLGNCIQHLHTRRLCTWSNSESWFVGGSFVWTPLSSLCFASFLCFCFFTSWLENSELLYKA